MTDFKHEECISRQYAVERLADIAYALTAGETLELRAGGEQIRVPVADEVLLKCLQVGRPQVLAGRTAIASRSSSR